jgi:uncharacterized protein (DUF433 family)
MASTAPFDIGTLITCTPGVYGGRPCLAGTRFPVLQIAAHAQSGSTPEEVSERFTLDLDKVFAGYAYYFANKAQVDAELAEDAAEYQRMAAEAALTARALR